MPGAVLSEFSAAGILLLQRIKVTYGKIVALIRIRGVGVSEKAYNPDSVSIFTIRGGAVLGRCERLLPQKPAADGVLSNSI